MDLYKRHIPEEIRNNKAKTGAENYCGKSYDRGNIPIAGTVDDRP